MEGNELPRHQDQLQLLTGSPSGKGGLWELVQAAQSGLRVAGNEDQGGLGERVQDAHSTACLPVPVSGVTHQARCHPTQLRVLLGGVPGSLCQSVPLDPQHSHAGPAGASVGPWGLAGRPLGTGVWDAEPEGDFLSDPLSDVTLCRGSCPTRGGPLLPGGTCGGQPPTRLCGAREPSAQHPLDQRRPSAAGQPSLAPAAQRLADHPQDRGKEGPGTVRGAIWDNPGFF